MIQNKLLSLNLELNSNIFSNESNKLYLIDKIDALILAIHNYEHYQSNSEKYFF